MNTYKLVKKYPSLPKDWEIGMEIGLGDRNYGYSPCSGKYTDCKKLNNFEVENYPEFWQEVIQKIIVIDTYNNSYYHKQPNGKFRYYGTTNQEKPVDSIEYTINDCEIGKKRYVFKNEIVQKDYEILELSFKRSERPEIRSVVGYSDGYIQALLKCENNIHSIKRLSDGEIFTIGDKINFGSLRREKPDFISSFVINKSGAMYVYTNPATSEDLYYIRHEKPPLFKTEDCVDIHVNQYSYGVHISTMEFTGDYIWRYKEHFSNSSLSKDVKYFSTEEKAKDYILMNKPVLSLNDVRNAMKTPLSWSCRLEELVKLKINTN